MPHPTFFPYLSPCILDFSEALSARLTQVQRELVGADEERQRTAVAEEQRERQLRAEHQRASAALHAAAALQQQAIFIYFPHTKLNV